MVAISNPTSINNSNYNVVPSSEIAPLTVNVTTDAYVDVMSLYVGNYKKVDVSITNTHATNGLTYRVLGNANLNLTGNPSVPTLPTTDYKWTVLTQTPDGQVVTTSGDVQLAALTTLVETLEDHYHWLVIQMFRTTASNSSSASVLVSATTGG